jgi:hypothetical protein
MRRMKEKHRGRLDDDAPKERKHRHGKPTTFVVYTPTHISLLLEDNPPHSLGILLNPSLSHSLTSTFSSSLPRGGLGCRLPIGLA